MDLHNYKLWISINATDLLIFMIDLRNINNWIMGLHNRIMDLHNSIWLPTHTLEYELKTSCNVVSCLSVLHLDPDST